MIMKTEPLLKMSIRQVDKEFAVDIDIHGESHDRRLFPSLDMALYFIRNEIDHCEVMKNKALQPVDISESCDFCLADARTDKPAL